VRDTGLLGDVADARGVEALAREHPDGGVEDSPPLLFRAGRTVAQGRRRVVVASRRMQAPGTTLQGTLVVDLSRYLPGAFASSELRRLGARVVRVEQPGGDPMRGTSPAWHDRLNAGKESVLCELPRERDFAHALLARADVVIESFRPGVAERLGVGAGDAPERAVYCSITGFGIGGPHEQRAGHDLNYLGWAGVLADTAPGLPPVPVADLAAGALGAVTEILAALLRRERTGEGSRIVVSMTHGAHALAARAPVLTQGFACYSMYATSDGRRLTVAALEPRFFARLCELLGKPELAKRQYSPEQAELSDALARVFAQRTLEDWLRVVDGEDVCVGPVATLAEADAELDRVPGLRAPALGAPSFGAPALGAPALGEHTRAWRDEVQV
jgi:alpha-methylacyl-CoA racemase